MKYVRVNCPPAYNCNKLKVVPFHFIPSISQQNNDIGTTDHKEQASENLLEDNPIAYVGG